MQWSLWFQWRQHDIALSFLLMSPRIFFFKIVKSRLQNLACLRNESLKFVIDKLGPMLTDFKA